MLWSIVQKAQNRIKIICIYTNTEIDYVQVFPEILPEMQPKLPEKRRQPKGHEKVPGGKSFKISHMLEIKRQK